MTKGGFLVSKDFLSSPAKPVVISAEAINLTPACKHAGGGSVYVSGIRFLISLRAAYNASTLFLCLSGFSLILSVVFFLTNMRPYQSHLRRVTPDIETPAAVGQYQHGSAKWLNDKVKDKAFESFVLDPNEPQIKELLRSGYDGLDFMKA